MSDLVKIRLKDSVVGNNFSYGKGENMVPRDIAAMLVKAGHGEYVEVQAVKAENPEQRKKAFEKRRTE